MALSYTLSTPCGLNNIEAKQSFVFLFFFLFLFFQSLLCLFLLDLCSDGGLSNCSAGLDMSWIGGLREATARNTTRFVVKGGTSPKERFRSSSAQRWRNPLGPLETARNPSKGPGWFAERVGIEGGKEAGFDADGYSWTDGRVRSRSSSGDGSGLGSTGSERSLSNGSTRVGAKKVAPSVIDAFIKRTARYKTDREEWLKKKEEEKAAAERPVLKPTISESSRKLRRSLKDLYNWVSAQMLVSFLFSPFFFCLKGREGVAVLVIVVVVVVVAVCVPFLVAVC